MKDSSYFISGLGMKEHVEGGFYSETYRNPYVINSSKLPIEQDQERSLSTLIYFLLESNQTSRFHQLKFDETWLYHYGSPMKIHTIDESREHRILKLGLNLEQHEMPQVLIPSGTIFGAEPSETNSYSLVSCMVSPGFDFRDFKLFTAQELSKLFPEHQKIINHLNG